MKLKELVKKAHRLHKPFRITDGEGFHLKDVDPGETLNFDEADKPRAKEALATGGRRWRSCRTYFTRRIAGPYC